MIGYNFLEEYNKLKQLLSKYDIDIAHASIIARDNTLEINTNDNHCVRLEYDVDNSVITLYIDGQKKEELRQVIAIASKPIRDPNDRDDVDKALVDKLREEWDTIDTWINAAGENGLFKVQDKIRSEEILDKLKEAKEALDRKDIAECRRLLSESQIRFYEAVEHAPLRWKLLHRYAFHIWIYLIAVLAFVTFFYYYALTNMIIMNMKLPKLALDAVAWGIIGSILRGIWWLWFNVNRNQFRKVWIIWYLSAPFIGGILGAFIYFTTKAGLIVLTGNTQDQAKIEENISFIILSVAMFAGFRWEWAIDKLTQIITSKTKT